MALLANFRSLSFVNYIGVDDFSDRLSYQISSGILMVLSVLVTARTYAMKPISCYLPQSFGFEKGGQVDFVDQYCLTEGTYAVSVKDFKLVADKEDGGLSAYEESKIYYYQWVPFVLAFQAVLCCLPRLAWRLVSFDRAGTDVGRIVKLAKDASEDTSGGEARKRMVTHLSRLIQRLIKRHASQVEEAGGCAPLVRVKRQLERLLPSQLGGNGLILTYLFIKLAYLLNAVGQLVTMKAFLQLNATRYSMPGIQLLVDIVKQKDWHNSMVFPRVGSCAVLMRSASEANWMFAQCALPVNMINEKIYVFLWFWFLIVSVITICSILGWIHRLLWRFSLINFVKDYMRLADNYYNELRTKKAVMHKFVKKYLSRDGAFLLKMIALNCGDMVCADVVSSMWETFLHTENIRDTDATNTRVRFCPVDTGILQLDCNGIPSNACKKRSLFKQVKSTPVSTSFIREDDDEMMEHANDVEQCRKEGLEVRFEE